MAPRARGRPPKANSQAEQLIKALDFVSVASGEHEFWHSYVRLKNNFAVASNGQMAAGHPIVEDLNCCPHGARMKSAIGKCGKSLALVQTPGGKLSIKGEKLNALVDCLPGNELLEWTTDAPCGELNEQIKEAFKVCGVLATEAGTQVVMASLLLEAWQCTGTNRAVVIQYWHGVNLPPNIVIPKAFAAAVAKQTLPLTGFGFAWFDDAQTKVRRVTFYFEGGAWISTVCYSDNWPNLDPILNTQAFPSELPEGLFEGVKAVAEHNENNYVTFSDGKVQSHRSDQQGASYVMPGLQGGKQFASKGLLQVSPYIKSMDYTTYPEKALFFGGEDGHGIRGAIGCVIDGSEGPQGQEIGPREDGNEPEPDEAPDAPPVGWN